LSASVGSDYHGWTGQRVHIGNLKKLPTQCNNIFNSL
jgi:hypothetical protein